MKSTAAARLSLLRGGVEGGTTLSSSLLLNASIVDPLCCGEVNFLCQVCVGQRYSSNSGYTGKVGPTTLAIKRGYKWKGMWEGDGGRPAPKVFVPLLERMLPGAMDLLHAFTVKSDGTNRLDYMVSKINSLLQITLHSLAFPDLLGMKG